MRKITRQMLKIYKPYSELDWMNYKLVKNNVTAHHIIKKCDGGKLVQENIALLMPVSHEYLHLIECKDIRTYEMINKMFRIINDQQHEPTIEERNVIEFMLWQFETQHKYDKNAKGKQLIKYKYLERW